MKARRWAGALLAGMLFGMSLAGAAAAAEAETEEAVLEEAVESAAEEPAAAEAAEMETEDAAADETEMEDAAVVHVGAMSGPTAMGLVRLMELSEQGETAGSYEFGDLATDPSAFAGPLTAGEVDIAAVPSNLAAALWNKTEGKIRVLAVNVLSVLNIVERGEEINSIADLKGKKLYATGQGATPEAVLTYLLSSNDLDITKDVEITWCADTTEALSYVTEDETAIAMLPQPFVTAACAKVEDLRVALNLGEEWEKVGGDSRIVTGVLAVNSAFADAHPEEVKTFLEEFAGSAAYTAEDPEGAAALIEKYGITANAGLALKALPECQVTCLTGEEMKEVLSGYLDILAQTNPSLVGGSVPGEDFYYMP